MKNFAFVLLMLAMVAGNAQAGWEVYGDNGVYAGRLDSANSRLEASLDGSLSFIPFEFDTGLVTSVGSARTSIGCIEAMPR